MKALSVVIVNFNAKEFLAQCLHSLQQALVNVDAEIIVVDNASEDGSKQYFDQLVKTDPFYSLIRFIYLNDNSGFSKANNIGIKLADARLILLLNPDTIVNADAIQQCLDHFNKFPKTGAVGVRMIDGKGKFLRESKRGYPTLLTTFYKSAGLSAMFPRSKYFGRYHLGNIHEDATAPVEILCGAFMMIRKEVLDLTGGFDEDFFMYGEDIDLSIRIHNAGSQLYYLGTATIIHFKGGSTTIGSVAHIKHFYNAMIIFVRKYYNSGDKKIVKFFLIVMIILRGMISYFAYSAKRLFKKSAVSSEKFRKG